MMTEMSPLGTLNVLPHKWRDAPEADRRALQCKQGRPVFGVEMTITDETGKPLPHDGRASGDLKVRGPWVCSGYHKVDQSDAHEADGWFRTGDVATIDPDFFMNVTDRAKDLIKSGGEWISSIDLENLAMGHPAVAQAAVIGIADEKWGERPLLIVVAAPGETPTRDELQAYFAERVAKWMVPDDVVVAEALPIGATGKVLKSKLRQQHADHRPASQ